MMKYSSMISRALREKDDVQARIRTISLLAVLLQGPFDTGNAILGSENLVDLMIQMADSNDPIQEVIRLIRFSLNEYSYSSVLQSKRLFYQHRRKTKLLVYSLKAQIF